MIYETLTSPVVLFFVLGFAAVLVRSDLAIPEAVAKLMSIYLIIAIGLKGGVEVASHGASMDLMLAAGLAVALSFLLPVPAFWLLRRLGRLGRTDAAAVAAHYGSASVVTFVTAREILTAQGLSPAGYLVAMLALMETPAIVTGLLLARAGGAGAAERGGAHLWHEVFANASVVLLIGSFGIGALAGADGFSAVKPVFDTAFRGILCLFMLDMGLIAARRLLQARQLTWRLALLALALPLINGTIGAALGTWIGLDVGSAAALAVLAASASYIAVPAAMRLALPEADPGIYLTMSLGLTFPFNILLGISFFTALARWMG